MKYILLHGLGQTADSWEEMLEVMEERQKLSCKTLVVCGERDKANKAAALQLGERIRYAEVCIIEGAGHEVNTDQPKKLGEVLEQFWGEV